MRKLFTKATRFYTFFLGFYNQNTKHYEFKKQVCFFIGVPIGLGLIHLLFFPPLFKSLGVLNSGPLRNPGSGPSKHHHLF